MSVWEWTLAAGCFTPNCLYKCDGRLAKKERFGTHKTVLIGKEETSYIKKYAAQKGSVWHSLYKALQ